ncbi:MAG: hypothetical protein RIS64_1041 [Bacteroidota bacterium]|jgi:hypothetical protein
MELSNKQPIMHFKNIQIVKSVPFKTAVDALLAMEQKLYLQKENGCKLTHLKLFKINELAISALQKEGLNTEILCDFGRFLHQYGIIDATQLQNCITDFEDYSTEYFEGYYRKSDTFEPKTIENTLQRSAYGGSYFEEFDYTKPDSEAAQALKESYGSFPTYTVEAIDKRNAYIKKVAAFFKAKVNKSAHKQTGITFKYGFALDDTSNSDWMVVVYIESNYMLVYSYFNTI